MKGLTLKGISKGAIPVMAGVGAVGLAIHYLGDKPVIKQIKEGLNGNVNGTVFSRIFG